MPEIRVNPIAFKDLLEIKSYLADELSSPQAAEQTLRKIVTAYENLATFPLMGRSLASVCSFKQDYRYLVCGSYLIFYTVDVSHVTICRILYGQRDYLPLLFNGNVE